MAKLTDRTALVTPADGDFYVTTDISDTTDAATGTDKKITFANLRTGIGAGLITQVITNGVTTTAPSEDAVFDALALKAPLASPTFTGTVTVPVGLTGVLRADTGVVSVDTDVTDIVTAASDSAAGKVELAIASELNTGTDTARAVTPDALAGSNFGIRYVQCVLNGTTALTTSEKVYFRIPAGLTGMNLVSVTGSVGTGASGSSSSGTPTFTVKNVTDNNQMLSTSLTIDANEYTSATAATAVVINTSFDDVVTDDLIEVAVTTAGTGVTYAVVTLGFQLP
jgi:hypothetical protein